MSQSTLHLSLNSTTAVQPNHHLSRAKHNAPIHFVWLVARVCTKLYACAICTIGGIFIYYCYSTYYVGTYIHGMHVYYVNIIKEAVQFSTNDSASRCRGYELRMMIHLGIRDGGRGVGSFYLLYMYNSGRGRRQNVHGRVQHNTFQVEFRWWMHV